MENEKNPFAFPCTDGNTFANNGMTLRDYFANSAMQKPTNYRPKNFYHWLRWFFGFSYNSSYQDHKQNAENAYNLADAMLKQRELNNQ
jgi:hypothetical protein